LTPSGAGDDAFFDDFHVPSSHYVDFMPNEQDPYYNGRHDDDDFGDRGKATANPANNEDAEMDDTPDAPIPAGYVKVTLNFETCAFCAAKAGDADYGKWLGCITWTWTRTAAGDTITIGAPTAPPPSAGFTNAVNEFDTEIDKVNDPKDPTKKRKWDLPK
ncbi:unnamed protein product, partial [marine sediment metagenome]